MARPQKRAKDYFGLWQNVESPINVVYARPLGPENAVGLEKTSMSMGFAHSDHKIEIEKLLHNEGHKDVKFLPMTYGLPLECEEKGNATITIDSRKRSKKWLDKETPILLNYYHGKTKHYIGTMKKGGFTNYGKNLKTKGQILKEIALNARLSQS